MKSGFSQRWLLILGSLSLVPIILVMALPMGFSRHGSFSALPSTEVLDYLSRPGRLQPLSPRFIAKILGGEIAAGLEPGRGFPISGRGSSSEGGRLTDVHPLTNDDVSDARVIPSVPFTAKTNSSRATREARDPSDCGSTGGTVWYRYTPTQDLSLIAYTFGSDHAISLGLFEGSPEQLRLIRCDTDTAANALIAFPAKAGRSYYFQIAAPLGGGNLVFSLDPHGAVSLESRSSSGEKGDGRNGLALSLSADGRFVVFQSNATNLVEGIDPRPCVERDPVFAPPYGDGPCSQIYIRDRLTGRTELVSATASGEPGNSASFLPFVSSNGRYITYESIASNLDRDDEDGGLDLFLYDRVLRVTEKIPASSPSSAEQLRENYTDFLLGSVSDDGRYVVFESRASNLVTGDNNLHPDVFVFDRESKKTELVSVSSSGRQVTIMGRPGSYFPTISADGRYVEFMTDSPDLVERDTNQADDVFLRDRLTRTTERVSVSWRGEEGDARTEVPGFMSRRISAGGRYVAFSSEASNLVPDDTNNGPDVFVRDRVAGTTIRISVSSTGDQPRGATVGAPWSPSFVAISGDGRHIVFDSNATNLAPGDSDQDWDVFVHDLLTRTTTLVTLSPSGEDASGQGAAISADGRVMAYLSGVTDRDASFTAATNDLFVYEAARRR